MDAFQFGFVEAIFKVLEERIPGGRFLVTLASTLIVLTLIVFALTYLGASFVGILHWMEGVSLSLSRPVSPQRNWLDLVNMAALLGIYAYLLFS
jgi:hypothetical protein